jgi:hypothetical protein
MKPRGIARMLGKWACTVLLLLLALLMAVSAGWDHFWIWGNQSSTSTILYVGGGIVEVGRFLPGGPRSEVWLQEPRAWNFGRGTSDWAFGLVYKHDPGAGRLLGVSLLYPILWSALSAAFLWWPDVRARRVGRAGLCKKCGYARAGLAADAACPECGTTSAPTGATK